MPAIDPGPPLPTRKQTGFSDLFSAWLIWFTTTFLTQFNAAIAALNLNSVQATSTSSVLIGVGAKTLITQTAKSYSPGMFIIVAETANASANYMYGQVTAYVSGTGSLSFTVPSGQSFGSGTLSAWSISFAAPGGATNTFVQQLVQNQTANSATTTGTLSALVFVGSPAYSAATAKQSVQLNIHVALTGGAVTLNGAPFINQDGSNPFTPINFLADAEYNGTSWVLKNTPVETTVANFTAITAANALNLTVQPTLFKYRSATLNNGVPQMVAAALASLVVPSGATLGAPAAITSASATMAGTTTLTINTGPSAPIQTGAIIYQAGARIGKVVPGGTYLGGTGTGTVIVDAAATFTAQAIVIINPMWAVVLQMANGEIATVNQAGGVLLDETGVISTTAISAGSTSATTIYSTTARTNQPYKVIGMAQIADVTVGTHTNVERVFGISAAGMATLGNGANYVDETTKRVLGQTYRNNENYAINIIVAATATVSSNLTLSDNGTTVSTIGVTAATSPQALSNAIKAGHSYLVNVSAGVPTISSWFELKAQ